MCHCIVFVHMCVCTCMYHCQHYVVCVSIVGVPASPGGSQFSYLSTCWCVWLQQCTNLSLFNAYRAGAHANLWVGIYMMVAVAWLLICCMYVSYIAERCVVCMYVCMYVATNSHMYVYMHNTNSAVTCQYHGWPVDIALLLCVTHAYTCALTIPVGWCTLLPMPTSGYTPSWLRCLQSWCHCSLLVATSFHWSCTLVGCSSRTSDMEVSSHVTATMAGQCCSSTLRL